MSDTDVFKHLIEYNPHGHICLLEPAQVDRVCPTYVSWCPGSRLELVEEALKRDMTMTRSIELSLSVLGSFLPSN